MQSYGNYPYYGQPVYPALANLNISGGTFNDVGRDLFADNTIVFNNNRGVAAFDILRAHATLSAAHNSADRSDAPKCHEGTRTAILNKIKNWVTNNQNNQSILWLNGPAGAGKSAIMQTIAEHTQSDGILAASFFFARNVETRDTAKRLIPTIAYQLALSIPAMKPFIEEEIESDRSIFDRSLTRQMHVLIVRPLREAYRSSGLTPESGIWLMLIDGLDECAGEDSQMSIIQEFSSILLFEKHPFRLIIASRPEWHLQTLFSHEGLRNGSWQLVLDEANADIQEFLRFRFTEMKDTHPLGALIPDSWPSPDIVQTLVDKSSGQFIYAATVVSYVSARQRNPIDSLDVVLGIKNPTIGDNPFAELDSLYRHILLTADKAALQMLSFIVVPVRGTEKLGMTMRSLALLLSIQHGEVYLSLLKFSSLLNVPPLEDSGKDIRVCHASLGDFLMDGTRAGPELFVEQGKVHAEIASRWLQQSFNPLGSPVTEARGFANHLSCASVTEDLTKELSRFNLVMWITIHINHPNDIALTAMSDVQNIIVRKSLAHILTSIQG